MRFHAIRFFCPEIPTAQIVVNGNQGSAYFEPSNQGCVSSGIKLRKLDDYWKQVLNREHVFAMKMDVQGFEGFVIKGGEEMFKSKPPVFFFVEFSSYQYRKLGLSPAQILHDLLDYGYSIIRTHDNVPITRDNGMVQSMANNAENVEYDLEMTHHGMLNKYKSGEISF